MTKDDEMLSNLAVRGTFACICAVRDAGYEWNTALRAAPGMPLKEEADAQETTWLVAGVLNAEQDFHPYQPLLEPELHRQFGRLLPTASNIKRFADRCGLLGNLVPLWYPEQQGKPQPLYKGESLRYWVQEIEKMAALLDLWEFIQYQKVVDGFHVQWKFQPTRVTLEWRFPSRNYTLYSIANEIIPSEKELVNILYKEADKPARLYFLTELQKQLKGRVNPQLNPFNTELILMVPDSLISALYVSFALEVCGQIEPMVKCRGCDIFFSPSKGKKYHDEKCKKRDWYRRHLGKGAINVVDA